MSKWMQYRGEENIYTVEQPIEGSGELGYEKKKEQKGRAVGAAVDPVFGLQRKVRSPVTIIAPPISYGVDYERKLDLAHGRGGGGPCARPPEKAAVDQRSEKRGTKG